MHKDRQYSFFLILKQNITLFLYADYDVEAALRYFPLFFSRGAPAIT